MLNCAVYYEGATLGRNDGNPLYLTAYMKRMQYFCDVANNRNLNDSLLKYFPTISPLDPRAEESARIFMANHDPEGLRIDHLRPHGDLKPWGTYDVNFWVDWAEDALEGVLPYKVLDCPKPMVYWASDTHLGYKHRLETARKADYVYCAQKRAVEEFKRDGIKNPVWLPHAVEPLAYPRHNYASKTYDVCFVGHVNSENRMEALDRLFASFPNFYYGQKRFEKAAEIFGKSKIVFNIAMVDDINMRTFEAMATGSMLLTNWLPTIEELFEDEKHLVLYRNLDEMVEKAKYYLAHDAEREAIARAGCEEVLKNHTFKNRIDKVLSLIPKKQLTGVA